MDKNQCATCGSTENLIIKSVVFAWAARKSSKKGRKTGQFKEVGARSKQLVFICEACRTKAKIEAAEKADWFDKFPAGSSCVYLVRGGDLWKIGFTSNLKKRMDSLVTMSPIPLILEHVWAGVEADERRAHKTYSKYRRHGEWFTFSPLQIEKMKKRKLPVLPPKTTGTRPGSVVLPRRRGKVSAAPPPQRHRTFSPVRTYKVDDAYGSERSEEAQK